MPRYTVQWHVNARIQESTHFWISIGARASLKFEHTSRQINVKIVDLLFCCDLLSFKRVVWISMSRPFEMLRNFKMRVKSMLLA